MRNTYVERWFYEEQKLQRRLQLLFLSRIFRRGDGFVFKGGTALDLFYNSGRFSEDLDFDCMNMDVLGEINAAIGSLKEEKVYAIFNDWHAERQLHSGFVRYVLKVSSTDTNAIVNLTIDCIMDMPKYQPESFALNYNDSIIGVKVMRAEEILAEKVSAVITREKARDLYDLYHLAIVRRVPISLKDVYEKCAKGFSSKNPKKYSFSLFEKSVKRLGGRWKELDPLLQNPEDYPFIEVSREILEKFKSL